MCTYAQQVRAQHDWEGSLEIWVNKIHPTDSAWEEPVRAPSYFASFQAVSRYVRVTDYVLRVSLAPKEKAGELPCLRRGRGTTGCRRNFPSAFPHFTAGRKHPTQVGPSD